jgi:hypothetical protein
MAAPLLELDHGRTLTAAGELVEVHAPDGRLEVRIRLTEDGPVLELESVRLALRASEGIAVDTTDFELRAAGEIALDAEGEVRVTGETIHLN